jgi:hypothetical protein
VLGLFGVLEDRIEGFDPEQPSERLLIDARLIGSLGLHPIDSPLLSWYASPDLGRSLNPTKLI